LPALRSPFRRQSEPAGRPRSGARFPSAHLTQTARPPSAADDVKRVPGLVAL
jgi:hypothetical protein